MNKLLQITTCGLKNIERPIVLDLANQTIVNGVTKINHVKGIYGYNGAGKTALIKSMEFYSKIVLNPDYLIQNETQYQLEKLINKKTNLFSVSCVFETGADFVVRHTLELENDVESNVVTIRKEKLEKSVGRTINDKYVTLIENNNGNIQIHPNYIDGQTELLLGSNLARSSFIPVFLLKVVENSNKKAQLRVDRLGVLLIQYFVNIRTIEVCTLHSDDFNNNILTSKQIREILRNNPDIITSEQPKTFNLNRDIEIVNKNEIDDYCKTLKGLTKFLKIFKPELKDIKPEKSIDGDVYRVKKVFVYKEYPVEFQFESSGIRQLTQLYWYLSKCAHGQIVFIDEMDVNINTVYFKKLVSYFANFGKGQLIFTTHNVESMEALKTHKRSISVIGVDGNLDTWVGKGNRSPINDYLGGYFPHSPMNVEDFDFISIFEGE